MTKGFVHSVKVPRLYKTAANVLKEIREKGGTLKTVLYKQKHPNISGIYSLCFNALQKEQQLNHVINKTGLLTSEPRFDPWLARILITELLWGKKVLSSDCKPVQIIRSYETRLKEASNTVQDEVPQNPIAQVRKARYVRFNTLLLPIKSGISYFEEEGWNLLPKCSSYTEHLDVVRNLEEPNFIQDYHIPELFVFPSTTSFYNNPGYLDGRLILQDKASCLPAHLLSPLPGSTVLDMCAAPGMKTSHLAAMMNNTGKIYAVELDKGRYDTLCEQVKVIGATCVETINKDALTLKGEKYSDVDCILVDPSCSGSGMLERAVIHGNEKCDAKRLKQLQGFQVFLLRHALFDFPNVLQVVYSTCSVHPEENEQVIDEVLQDVRGAYSLVPLNETFGKDWLNYSSSEYQCSNKCIYAKPETDLCNGFFVAVFERNRTVPLPPCYKRKGEAPSIENMLKNARRQEKVDKLNEKARENAEQPEATDKPNEEIEASASRKKKKRGKRKKKNAETPVPDEMVTREEIKEIQQGKETNKAKDEKEIEEVEDEPVKKKKKIRKDEIQITDDTSIVEQESRKKHKKKKKKKADDV